MIQIYLLSSSQVMYDWNSDARNLDFRIFDQIICKLSFSFDLDIKGRV